MINRPLVSLFILLCATSATAAQREVLSAASESRYWVAQVLEPGERSATSLRTEIRMRDVSSGVPWQRVAVVGGRVRDIAHRHADAAVLMDDQSWLLVWPGGSSRGPGLPDGAILRALTSDDQSLWAVGVPINRLDASTQPAQPRVEPGQMQTYLFTGNGWEPRAIVPAEARNDSRLSTGMFDNRPMIAWQTAPREISFTRLRRSGDWTGVETLKTSFAIDDFRLLSGTAVPTIWIAAAGSAGEVRLLRDTWGIGVPLLADSSLRDAASKTTAYFSGHLRLLTAAGDRLSEQSFTLDGTAAGKPVNLGRLPPVHKPMSIWSILLMALIAVLLSSAVFRSEAESEASAAIHVELAPFARRFVAGMIDLFPLIIVTLWRVSLLDRDAAAEALADQTTLLYLAAGAISYLCYTTTMEMVFGRTVGKIACRLRVVGVDGTPPKRSSLLLRNLVRVIDVVPGSPLLLLIFLSPLRQRLGDVMAGTIVIRDPDTPDPIDLRSDEPAQT
ncbi:MAG TPA: RDD family protein [Tepidisphaeraceae bacterium]|nr:RDD family protein [Tepidisphaeraceae bacterium]